MQPPKDLSVYPGRLPGRGNAEVIDNVVQAGELSVEFEQDALLERLPDLWLERVEGLVDLEEVEVVRTLVRCGGTVRAGLDEGGCQVVVDMRVHPGQSELQRSQTGVRSLVDRFFLVLLLGFSTQIWWVTTRGGVWHTGHLIATILTLGCLIELWGSRRAWLIGLLAGFAFLTRAPLAFAIPFYALLLAGEGIWEPRRFACP